MYKFLRSDTLNLMMMNMHILILFLLRLYGLKLINNGGRKAMVIFAVILLICSVLLFLISLLFLSADNKVIFIYIIFNTILLFLTSIYLFSKDRGKAKLFLYVQTNISILYEIVTFLYKIFYEEGKEKYKKEIENKKIPIRKKTLNMDNKNITRRYKRTVGKKGGTMRPGPSIISTIRERDDKNPRRSLLDDSFRSPQSDFVSKNPSIPASIIEGTGTFSMPSGNKERMPGSMMLGDTNSPSFLSLD